MFLSRCVAAAVEIAEGEGEIHVPLKVSIPMFQSGALCVCCLLKLLRICSTEMRPMVGSTCHIVYIVSQMVVVFAATRCAKDVRFSEGTEGERKEREPEGDILNPMPRFVLEFLQSNS